MVNVSKKYLTKELREKAWGRFLEKIQTAKSTDALIVNLRTFFTQSEIIMLEKRLAIPILVEQKTSYREMRKILDVSSNTISFVKHNLTKKPVVHKKYSG